MELLGTSTLRPPFCYGGELFICRLTCPSLCIVLYIQYQACFHQRDIQKFGFGLAGVDISIQDFSGQNILIREKPKVNVGHIARGISEQV